MLTKLYIFLYIWNIGDTFLATFVFLYYRPEDDRIPARNMLVNIL